MSEKIKGICKWYNERKGFGFITGEDGNDYFFHYTQMPEDTVLQEADKVEFETMETDKGIQAQNIKLV